ncbi:glycosyltransferase family 4 protein [Myroides odoratimimus]|uniref:glycosyltransferase family 4 protein n=1 Tax=Myroides odoratimimus TaxID=76832 RepID=UPI0025761321|nr:glycosyltransferase family 4 protein [Myroides odoratimimus]MDM1412157.1 glycosyltransferase family 4 protein [Myroides odoratimimus]
MLNIIHVGGHYDQFRGGGNLRNVELFKELSVICNIYVIAFIENRDNIDKNLNSDHSFKLLVYEGNFIKQLLLVLKIVFLKDIDVIHVHNLRLAVALRILLPFKKLVIEFHGIKDFTGLVGKLSYFIMSRLNGFIVLSNTLKEYFSSKYGLSKNKIEFIVNGYNLGTVYKYPIEEVKDGEEISVAYIGTLHDWQGVFNFADVIDSILKKSNLERKVVFKFIGNGNVLEKLKNQLGSYVESGKVIFVGEVAPKDISKYWQDENIIVMPRPSTVSTETIIPLKVVDALKYSKLIVASDVGGLVELLTHDKNAIIYDKNSLLDFEEKLVFCIENYNDLAYLRENASNTAENLPTWKDQAFRVQAFYKEL